MKPRWLAAALLSLLAIQSLAETRVALVIGNSRYAGKPLKNPANDADAMAKSLRKHGFEVEMLRDASLDDLRSASRRFLDRAQAADVRLFYYAGHAAQVRGNNYLAPVDRQITYEDELESRGLNISNEVVARLDGRNRLNIVILDACRDNPYQVRTRSQGRGLAPLESPSGTLIAYATAPGDVAEDSPDRPNSRYTAHLLEALSIPGLMVEDVFKRVTTAVVAETGERSRPQIPWYHSSVTSDFCFASGPDGRCGGSSAPPVLVAKASGQAGRTRSDAPEELVRPSNDPLSVELFYRVQEEARRLRTDKLDEMHQAAERGDLYAMTVLGLYYEDLDASRPFLDRPKAVQWYRKAADRGYAPAEFFLGTAYAAGAVTGQADQETARRYYQAGEKRGYAPAQKKLAELLEDTEPAKALALYRKAADQGHVGAMANLSLLYLKGRGTSADISSAERWSRLAYERQQNEMAQHILGYLYTKKLIKPRDEMDDLRLASFARLREPWGRFMYGVE
jgi:uncharacterized caspase-like protein/TPR repeat protein